MALQPFDNFRLTAQARFDEQTFDVHAMETGVNFDIDRLNAAVNYVNLEEEPIYGRDDARQQVWATADYALYGGFSVFGGFRYDIESDSMIRNVVGLGYDCDCADVRISYQEEYQKDRDIEPNRSIQFSVQLKTLGGEASARALTDELGTARSTIAVVLDGASRPCRLPCSAAGGCRVLPRAGHGR